MQTKWCKGCERNKSLSDFHNSKAAKDGKQSKCIECKREHAKTRLTERRVYMQGYREKNAERLQEQARAKTLENRYGLTPEQFEAILSSQGGGCASCGLTEPLGGVNWHVDHDHSCCPGVYTCGECIRGILCPRCNKGIGMFEDNSNLLLAAAAYLIRAESGEIQKRPLPASIHFRPATGQ